MVVVVQTIELLAVLVMMETIEQLLAVIGKVLLQFAPDWRVVMATF